MEESLSISTSSNTKQNKTEGTFVFRDSDENEICLFLFKKLTKKQMDVALPAQIGEQPQADYFVGIFRKGCDYLGKTEFSGIKKIMKDEKMFNLNDTYQNISTNFKNFSEKEYSKYKEFAKKHMETFYKIEEHVK